MSHVKTIDGYDVKVPSQGQVTLNSVLSALGTAGFVGLNLKDIVGGLFNRGAFNGMGLEAIMAMLGVDIRTYNIYDELGFLLKPTMRRVIQPTLAKYLGGMTDAEVEEMAMEYVEAMREKANERGYVNIFGIQVGANAFDGLKDILINKFNQ